MASLRPRRKAAAHLQAQAQTAPPPPPPPIDLDLAARARLFPVRHHSPRSSAVLAAFLDAVDPALVLVESPADAAPLLPVLCDPETTPPVAILGYRTDGTPDSALWPFCAYSPEYVAFRWAAARGVPARPIDLLVGQALAAHGTAWLAPGEEADRPEEGNAEEDLHLRCARRFGHRSFEEFWEAMFEAPTYAPAEFSAALLSYADALRASGRTRRYDRARDALMAARITEAAAGLAPGGAVPPERIAVVLGAAHAAALAARDVDPDLAAALPAPLPSAVTLIPFSFPRLAEQLGYGAGNRAPHFYQRAHDAGGDFRRAALEVLCEFTAHLRLRGFSASLADTIEAYRLAAALAELRDKAAPGLDEVREAAIAALCRGEAEHIGGFLWPSVVGRRVGKVAGRLGRNSLQEEFDREVSARRLPLLDEDQSFILQLHNEDSRAASAFLHRLRVAGVPYATYLGSHGSAAIELRDGEEAGGAAALSRRREKWSARWTPALETALIEKIVFGDTLEQVARHELEERLAGANATAAAADVLAEAVLCRCPQVVAHALSTCEELAISDDDLPSLAQACHVFAGVCTYGSARLTPDAAGGVTAGPILALCQATFLRAALRAAAGCDAADEAIPPALHALKLLHEIALARQVPGLDPAPWLSAADELARSYAIHPRCAGYACALLCQSGHLPETEVALLVGQRLSDRGKPGPASAFLTGFFQVNTAVLSRNKAVAQALDAFLCGIEPDRFRDALPGLRRAFGQLGATERRYLLENLLGLRRIGPQQAREAQAVLAARDREALAQMSGALSAALDDLDDLL